jgi:hypothetical protein
MKVHIFFSVLLLVLYPIVPVVSYFYLLWNRPKITYGKTSIKKSMNASLTSDEKQECESAIRYREAEYFAMLSHAISGGIESPIQFILQVRLKS